MFVGGLMIAIAVEHCNLHKRTALWVILKVGCSPRKLIFGLTMVSMFVSMWISNTAAIAMMCPIMEAVLKELEEVYIYFAIHNSVGSCKCWLQIYQIYMQSI